MRCDLMVACLLSLIVSLGADAKEIQAKDGMGRDYWLYVPDKIDPEKTYTLVVGVHGANGIGKGAAGHAGWVNKYDVIVLGPSYRNSGGAFQYLQGDTDKQTIELFKTLRKEYKLNDKIFIAGFSGGSQYAHRFAMKYPGMVAGCAAHSGGTWATGDYPSGESPNPKARGVLFVISCGEKDTKKSFSQAPLGRLEWAKKYEQMLKQGGFVYDHKWIEGVGHQYSRPARQMTEDCYTASILRLPKYEAERDAISKALRARDTADAWSLVRTRLNHADKENDGILGKVHRMYVESLDADIARIDRLAEREVRNAIRKHEDASALKQALQSLAEQYAGAEKTTALIQAELAKLD